MMPVNGSGAAQSTPAGASQAKPAVEETSAAVQLHNTPEVLQLYQHALRQVTSRISTSSTATRLNLHNSSAKDVNEAIKGAIRAYNTQKRANALRQLPPPPYKEFFAQYVATNKLQALLTPEVMDKLHNYYEQLSVHSATLAEARRQSPSAPLIPYMPLALESNSATCFPLANLVALGLLHTSKLPPEIKGIVRQGVINSENPEQSHCVVVIGDGPNVIVLDPWPHYLTHTSAGQPFSCPDGFCGKELDYLGVYNSVADNYALLRCDNIVRTELPFDPRMVNRSQTLRAFVANF